MTIVIIIKLISGETRAELHVDQASEASATLANKIILAVLFIGYKISQ